MVVTKNNFKDFLDTLSKIHLRYDAIKNIEITESQLKKLNQVLRMTLLNILESECNQGDLIIKGNYIKFSDFTDINGSLSDLCGNGGNIKSINIFTLRTVFIDTNFEGTGKELQFSVVAPKWEIIDNRNINLNGISSLKQSKAPDGANAGSSGKNGKPGPPGGPAGNFFGNRTKH